jgi:hypothetical protein
MSAPVPRLGGLLGAAGVLFLLLHVPGAAPPASAETKRPLVTEDVDTLDDGEVEIQVALEGVREFRSPTGALTGPLLRAPILGVNLGMGGRTEIQVRAPLRQRFDPDQDRARSASGDLTLATKVRLFGGRGIWPGLGLRALVKLPNVSEETGIGTDETDLTLELLAGIDLAGAAVALSAGYAILGDPTRAASQNDKLVLGGGFILPVGLLELAADLHGVRWGDRTAPDEWTGLAGLAGRIGPLRLDVAAGVASREAERSLLFTAGAGTSFHLR